MTSQVTNAAAPALDLAPLSVAQQRMWLAERAAELESAYLITRVIHLRGPLQMRILQRALDTQLRRHEVLRTGIIVSGGRPVQRVAPSLSVDLTPEPCAPEDLDRAIAARGTRRFAFDGRALLRADLLRLGATHHCLVLVAHHLILDAASLDRVIADLLVDYSAGGDSGRPPPPSYREAVLAQSAQMRDRGEQAAAEWVEELRDMAPVQLVSDQTDVHRTRCGSVVSGTVPAAHLDAARPRARTLSAVALAALAVILHRFARTSDIVIGVPISARTDDRFAETVGLFTQTLPIRVRLGGNPTLGECVRRCEEALVRAWSRPIVRMDEVVAALRLPRAPGRDPLFEVTLGVVPPTLDTWSGSDLEVSVARWYAGQTKFDLHLEVVDAGRGQDLVLEAEVDEGRLRSGMARAVVDGVASVMAAIGSDPDTRIGDLPLPGTRARGQAFTSMGERIDISLREVVGRTPDAPAVRDTHGVSLSYAELLARAETMAGWIQAHGVAPGERIGLAISRGVDLIVAEVAVLLSGCAYVPLDPRDPTPRLAQMVRDSRATVVLTSEDLHFDVPVLDPREARACGDLRPVVPTGEDAAYVLFTSGSTGIAKPVVVPHRGVLRLPCDKRFTRGTWLHSSTPLFDASTVEVWVPLLRGDGLIVLDERPSVHDFRRAVSLGAQVAMLSTGLLNVVADEDVEALRGLDLVLTGGDVMSPRHGALVLAVVPRMINLYGPTENTVVTTMHVLDQGDGVPTPIPVGAPFAGTDVAVVDQYGHLVPDGVEGAIVTGGAGLATAYEGRPALTAERFTPARSGPAGGRWYHTGDLGWFDSTGILHFLGRRDDQVKVRGFRVEPAEVEHAAESVPGVDAAAVVAHTDASGDKTLVGFYAGSLDATTLTAALLARLPEHLRPTRWTQLPELPLGSVGKVDRHALRARAANTTRREDSTPSGVGDPPSTLLEQLLASCYADLLRLDDVGLGTDFFAAGGHSLLASRLTARVRRALDVDLPLSAVLGNPRLGDLAQLIRSGQWRGLPPVTVAEDRRQAPLSSGQARMWFLEQLDPATARYHVPLRLRLRGPVDPADIEHALRRLAESHTALRTTLTVHEDEPRQVVASLGEIPLHHVNLSELDPDLRDPALQDLAARTVAAPFDLREEPGWRALLVTRSEHEHELLLVLHHIVTDGAGLSQLLTDLLGSGGTDAGVDFIDVAHWERTWLDGEVGQALEEFWRHELEGAPSSDPWARRRLEGGRSQAGGLHRFGLGHALTASLKELATREGVTPFVALLTVFAASISAQAGMDEVIVGTPFANRADPITERIVGPFVNTVPIRIPCDPEDDFSVAAEKVAGRTLRAIGHGELPFDRIARASGRVGDVDGSALVHVVFGLQPSAQIPRRWGRAEVELLGQHTGTAKFDLTMSLFDDGSDLTGYVEYSTDLFAADEIADLVGAFLDSIDTVVATGEMVTRSVFGAPRGPREQGPERLADGSRAERDGGQERGDVEQGDEDRAVLTRIWTEVLAVPPELSDDFFALGGHSLAATRVVSRVRRDLGRDVSLRMLFDHPVFSEFLTAVATTPLVEDLAPAVRVGHGPAPLTGAQSRLWVRHRLGVDDRADAVPVIVAFDADPGHDRLTRALTLLAVRHPSLRTRFVEVDGLPQQVVGDPVPVVLHWVNGLSGPLDDALAWASSGGWALDEEAPWRASLIRSGEQSWHLVLTFHHLLIDGWSLPVLLEDLDFLLDGGGAAEQDHPRPEPAVLQVGDIARWQQGGHAEARARRVAERLRDLPDLSLPVDPRAARALVGDAEQIPLRVEPDLTAELGALAREHGTSLFAVLLAVQIEVLRRFTGQETFAVGTHHAGRHETRSERIVGNLVNTVVIRADARTDPTWAELLDRTSREVNLALGDADVPFESVLRALGGDRHASAAPLFQTMCILQNVPKLPTHLGGLPVRHVRQPYRFADVDVALWWVEDEDGALRGGLTYARDLLDPTTAAAMADLTLVLMRDIVLRRGEKSGSGGRPEVPEPRNPLPPHEDVVSRWLTVARAAPEADALIWTQGSEQLPQSWSHAELATHVERCAAALRHRGVGPEKRVVVLSPRSPTAVVGMLAVLHVGAAYVPVDPDQPVSRVRMLLERSGADLVLVDAGHRDLAGDGPALTIPSSKTRDHEQGQELETPAEMGVCSGPAAVVHPEQAAYVIFTSGSTGIPKPVVVSRRNLTAYLSSMERELALSDADRVLHFASPSFDASTEEIFPALLAGASIVLRPPSIRVPDEAFDRFLAVCRPTVLSLPVTFWTAWVDRLASAGSAGTRASDGPVVPDTVRTVLLNAEEPGVGTFDLWLHQTAARVPLVNTYGPTEGTVTATLHRPSQHDGRIQAGQPESWGRFPVGRALDGVALSVVDRRGRRVPTGAVGELVIGGDQVTRGYLAQPAATADAYRPDPDGVGPGSRRYHTGDAARVISGDCHVVLGRIDRQVKIRGHRVEPGEVEVLVSEHCDSARVVVIDRASSSGVALVAVVETTRELDGLVLRQQMLNEVPAHLVPARILTVPILPRGSNDKVDRDAVRVLVADLESASTTDPSSEGTAPLSVAERTLHDIWSGVLGRTDFGVDDGFFALGGDSIRGLLVANRARQRGLELTTLDVFTHQTIRELGARVTISAGPETRPNPNPNPSQAGPGDRQMSRAAARLKRRPQ